MGVHEDYGKSLLRKVAGVRFVDWRDEVVVPYEGGTSGRIDGVIEGGCAVEIESRVDKQIRGALLDLLMHPFNKKLLVIVPVHMHNPTNTRKQCEGILRQLKRPGQEAKVVLLKGTGDEPCEAEDRKLIEDALRELRCM